MNELFRYRKLQQFGTLILRETQSEKLQETLFELLPEVLDIDVAALFLQSENSRWFLKAASEDGTQLRPVLPRLKKCVNKADNEGVDPPTFEVSPLIYERKLKPGSRGFPVIVAFPLLIMGRIRAFIVAARRKQRAFTADDLNRLDHVAALVSTAMENQFVVQRLTHQADHLKTHKRVLLDTLPDGMYRVNDRFEIVEINKQAANLLGVDSQSLIGKKCYETICTESKESCPIYGKGRDAISYETRLSSLQGETFPVMKSIRRYNLGARDFTMETFKDIAHFKRMEAKLVDYAENLELRVDQRTEELRKAQLYIVKFERLVAAGQLAASIAHEINNPIYGIRGCLQSVLEETELNPDLKQYVELSIQETDRISELIKGMQNFHKTSKSSRKLEDVTDVLEDILVLYRKFLKDKKIVLLKEFESNLPKVSLCADEIKQVFINLITNAAESMPKGGKLKIKTFQKAGTIEIHFTDTGCGMTRDVRERIFDAFFTTKAAVKGVGLGLPVCWGIIQGHGGQMHVKSRSRKGSTFIMALPVAKKQKRKTKSRTYDEKQANQTL